MSIGGTLLPPPYGAYPYPVQTSQVLPTAVSAANAASLSPARIPASFAYPSPFNGLIYWPYPSPPVSPTTYYAHSGPTMVNMRGLPYSVQLKDVLNFFNGWEVRGLYVSITY